MRSEIFGMNDRVEEIDHQPGDETDEDVDGHGRCSLNARDYRGRMMRSEKQTSAAIRA